MLVNAENNNLNHQNVKNLYCLINLVIGHLVYMYQYKIQFYNTISKLGHKCQRAKSHTNII